MMGSTLSKLILTGLALVISTCGSLGQTIDQTFVSPTVYQAPVIQDMASTSDNKLLLAGYITNYGDQQVYSLVRLNQDGSLDESFDYKIGKPVSHVEVQSNGRVVIASSHFVALLSPTGELLDSIDGLGGITALHVNRNDRIAIGVRLTDGAHVMRLNADFSEDTGFDNFVNTNGVVTAISSIGDTLIIAGIFTEVNGVEKWNMAKLNVDGSLNLQFDIGSGIIDLIGSLTIDTNGKIYLGDTYTLVFDGQFIRGGLVRLNSNGSIDTTFVVNGIKGRHSNILLQGDKIIFNSYFGSNNDPRIVRLNHDGSTDSTFHRIPFKLGRFPNGRLAWVGDSIITSGLAFDNYPFELNKVSPNGVLDVDFKPPLKSLGAIRILKLQNDKLIVGGDFTEINGVYKNRVARLSRNGELDESWLFVNDYEEPNDIEVLQNDQVMIGFDKVLLLLEADGSINNDFHFEFPEFSNRLKSFEFFDNGKILLSLSGSLLILDKNGAVDTSFDTGSGFNVVAGLSDILITSDQKIIHGGSFTEYNGNPFNRLIRLNQDGSIDNTFNIGNGAGGDKSYILNMIELPSNELIISGGYQSFGNIQVPGFAKLSEDGSIDAEFMDKQPLDANGSFPSGPTSILQLEDQLFIGGLLRAKGSNVNSEQILSLKFDGTWNEDFCIDNILEIEQIWGLAKGPDNTFFAFGNFFDKSGDRQFVVKISADPNPKITSLDAGLVTESKVYPNPADVDVITFDSPLLKGTELKLFDNMGRQVQVNYTSSEANNQTTVDIKELKNGTYLLKVMRSNTSLASHRLVINR